MSAEGPSAGGRRVKAPVCIIGGGPAAVIAADRLARLGCSPILVSPNMMGLLDPISVEEHRVNPAPIFPVRGSRLSQWYGLDEYQGNLTVDYRNEREPASIARVDVGSFAHKFGRKSQGQFDRSTILGVKQFGDIVLKAPLRQLQLKVLRQYGGAMPREQRIAYRQGRSAYWWRLQDVRRPTTIAEAPTAIDAERKLVHTRSAVIEFETLISTLPMPTFLRLTQQIGELSLLSRGMDLMIFLGDGSFPENTLLYDADPSSAVYRVFFPTPHTAAVQIANGRSGESHADVGKALVRLLGGSTSVPRFARRMQAKVAYPLDVEPAAAFGDMVAYFRQRGVRFHGRLAQWEYVDLHELDWSGIDDVAKHHS